MPSLADNWGLYLIAGAGLFLLGVAIRDVFFQSHHTIQHNFPIVGHLRYWLEMIGPELRQYWVANDKEELPFSRSERAWVYASAKGQNNHSGFGTSEQLYSTGYPIIKHSTFPFPDSKAIYIGGDPSAVPCLKVMGPGRRRPFHPSSVINISAMSFGSLGERAVSSLNRGAQLANCYQNTGEGGFSRYHALGADMIFQIGTGYFGACDKSGNFSLEVLAARVEKHTQIRAIEIKLSQGAKPGKGGILPAKKVTQEIADVRGVAAGKDCISPNSHREFQDVDSLIDFVEIIAARTGLPVGIKSAVGELIFWDLLARIGSGKLGFPDRAAIAFALGCDLIHIAREAMLSIGCIQAQKCHTDHCPAGIATQNRWLQSGLNVEQKAERLSRYVKSFRKELISLAHAAGYEHPALFTGRDIEICTGANQFTPLSSLMGYDRRPIPFVGMSCVENLTQKAA
ncbi:MAG: FMN-binding glutamate synthase family protein [Deltaproteobacteria bacterium]|nr:FMN-binding glutamate synthase family protein [Deltaproteobacteria bacterium]